LEARIQPQPPLTYLRARQRDSVIDLTGRAVPAKLHAVTGDVEIWITRARGPATIPPTTSADSLFARPCSEIERERSPCATSSFYQREESPTALLAIDVDDNVVEAPSSGCRMKLLAEVRSA
jgi:hypothetical protein